jgi:hypothetical protein
METKDIVIHFRLAILIVAIPLCVAIGTAIQQSNMTAQQTSADPESSYNSNIQSLTAERNRQQDLMDRWNTGYIVALCLAIIVGISTAFAQWKTISLSKRLALSQSLIENAKDRESREELGKRDTKIAELNESSARTSERAGKLEVQAESLRADAERSRASMASAQAEAAKAIAASKEAIATVAAAEARSAEAVAKAEAFRLDIAKANESAKQAEARTAQAELELARIRDPRILTLEQQRHVAEALRQFPKQDYAFQVFSDPEALSLLSMLDVTLKAAGWNRVKSPSFVSGDMALNTPRGEVPQTTALGVSAWIAVDDIDSRPIAASLAAALSSQGLPCQWHLSEILKGYKPRLIIIVVGKKP